MRLAEDVAFHLCPNDDHSGVIGDEQCIGPQHARGVSNVRCFWKPRLLSPLLTCSVGGDGEAVDWVRGAERRCIDEYALAVKGGRRGENGYAALPKTVAEQESMIKAWQGNCDWRCSRLCT